MKKREKHFLNNYDAVIFDFDGTIADLDTDWHQAKEALFEFLKRIDNNLFLSLDKKKLGVSEKINLYLEKYGKTLKRQISGLSAEAEDRFLSSWREKTKVVKSIGRLKDSGVKLFIWTLNTRPTVNKVLRSLNIDSSFFVKIISLESGLYIKPDTTYLTKTLKEYNIKNPIYIGDSYYDVLASKKAKIKYLDFSRIDELFAKFNN